MALHGAPPSTLLCFPHHKWYNSRFVLVTLADSLWGNGYRSVKILVMISPGLVGLIGPSNIPSKSPAMGPSRDAYVYIYIYIDTCICRTIYTCIDTCEYVYLVVSPGSHFDTKATVGCGALLAREEWPPSRHPSDRAVATRTVLLWQVVHGVVQAVALLCGSGQVDGPAHGPRRLEGEVLGIDVCTSGLEMLWRRHGQGRHPRQNHTLRQLAHDVP